MLLDRLHRLGHFFFYMVIKFFGQWSAYLLVDLVVSSYLLGSVKIHKQVAPYLTRRFPQAGGLRRFGHTFLLLRSFARSLVDRAWLGIDPNCSLSGRLEGGDSLMAEIAKGYGLVGVVAHVGSWQSAFVFLECLKVPVNVVMRYREEAATKHFFQLAGVNPPFNIIDPKGFMGGLVEAQTALERGELVLFMGDRLEGSTGIEVSFLGDWVTLPIAPYLVAAAAHAPVAVMLSAKVGQTKQIMAIRDLFYPQRGFGQDRKEAMKPYVARFVQALETYVMEHPHQWYNFFNFWCKQDAHSGPFFVQSSKKK